jgi:hypothetical protein
MFAKKIHFKMVKNATNFQYNKCSFQEAAENKIKFKKTQVLGSFQSCKAMWKMPNA